MFENKKAIGISNQTKVLFAFFFTGFFYDFKIFFIHFLSAHRFSEFDIIGCLLALFFSFSLGARWKRLILPL